MNSRDTTALSAQLRAVLGLTNTEIQIADTRIAQARTEEARRRLSANADNARDRARAIEAAIRELGDVPERVAPFIGRGAAVIKAVIDQAQPFDEALLGDLAREHQLLDRARYIMALATATGHTEVVALAQRLITAHSETVDWLTTVLAEDALGGPAALRHTRLQTGAGTLVKLVNLPVSVVHAWPGTGIGHRPRYSARSVSCSPRAHTRAMSRSKPSPPPAMPRSPPPSRSPAMKAPTPRPVPCIPSAPPLEPGQLPIAAYDELTVAQAAAAIKELTDPADIRTILTYEQTNKDRHRVISAVQSRLTAIAHDLAGLS